MDYRDCEVSPDRATIGVTYGDWMRWWTARIRFPRASTLARRATAVGWCGIDAEMPVKVCQQPRRTDQQELDVLEERGLLALDFVPYELADPGGNEDADEQRPGREGQVHDEPVSHRQHDQRDDGHADRQWR